VTTWNKFLIGPAPLASTLSVIGLVESTGDRWAMALYLLLASLPGLVFTYGYNWSADYTRALREFSHALVPADDRLYETLGFFKNKSFTGGTVIIADPHCARYVHLAIRNSDPSRLIWAWTSPVTNGTICAIAESTGAEEVVLAGIRTPGRRITAYNCLSSINRRQGAPMDASSTSSKIREGTKYGYRV